MDLLQLHLGKVKVSMLCVGLIWHEVMLMLTFKLRQLWLETDWSWCLFFQLGPYLDTLKEILASMFGITEEPKNEEMIKLKILFEALDRPEFLSTVPKVSAFHFFGHLLDRLHVRFSSVFEPPRNSYECRNSQDKHDIASFWAHGRQHNQARIGCLHAHGALPDPLWGQLQRDLQAGGESGAPWGDGNRELIAWPPWRQTKSREVADAKDDELQECDADEHEAAE